MLFSSFNFLLDCHLSQSIVVLLTVVMNRKIACRGCNQYYGDVSWEMLRTSLRCHRRHLCFHPLGAAIISVVEAGGGLFVGVFLETFAKLINETCFTVLYPIRMIDKRLFVVIDILDI